MPRRVTPAIVRSRRIRGAIVDATLAASVHNSQPWRFAIGTDAVEVHVDPAARPRVIDRDGRWVLESVGAATANLQLGLRFRTGRATRTTIFPESVPPADRSADVLVSALDGAPVAVVELLDDAVDEDDAERLLHEAVPARRTSRGPLYGELTAATWAAVQRAGTPPGAQPRVRTLRPDAAATAGLVDLVRAVEARWRDDIAYLAEIQQWTSRTDARGIPPALVGAHDPTGGVPQRDFAVSPSAPYPDGGPEDRADVFEVSPQLLALVGTPEEPETWVRAGMAMQRVMLAATAAGAGVGVLGQLVEDDDARGKAGRLLGLDGEVVQQVLRLGAVDPDPGRRRSPRRPVHETIVRSRRAGPDSRPQPA